MGRVTDQQFRTHLIDYIREHYGDILGPHTSLLDEEGGLDKIQDLLRRGVISY